MKPILEDQRPITSIRLAEEAIWVGGEAVWIGDGTKIDSIVAYDENGEMAAVLWFAIYSRGEIIRRVNSKFVESVMYK